MAILTFSVATTRRVLIQHVEGIMGLHVMFIDMGQKAIGYDIG